MMYLIALAAFGATYLGGLFALRLRDRLHLILGFSAGAVIAVAFFDLMPESLQLIGSASLATTLMALGFALYLILDRAIVMHKHHDDEHAHSQRGTLGVSTLALHSFLDGAAIGLSFQVSAAVGAIVTIAVLVHDFSDGINTVNMILKNAGDRARAMRWLLIDAVAPVIGVAVGTLFTISSANLGALLALFSGFFLYIGASDLLPESHHGHPVWWTTFATLAGMLALFIAIQAL